MKYNPATLNKIEKILEEGQYIVRYERGTFQSGYCILEAKKVVVLNKFLNVEGRINTHESQILHEAIAKKAILENRDTTETKLL